VGSALGAAVALLYAPQSGEGTRDSLKRKGLQFKDSAADIYDQVKDQTTTIASQVKDSATNLASTVKDGASQVASGVSDTLTKSKSDLSDEADNLSEGTSPKGPESAATTSNRSGSDEFSQGAGTGDNTSSSNTS
jgi:gas vesicle protein